MIQREVTVGRAFDSDILYDLNCVHVSNAHAVIYSNGNQLIFKDTSTNGTLINSVQVHHQSVVITYGDVILLAGKYPLTWDKIEIFFPFKQKPTQIGNGYSSSRNGTVHNQVYPQQPVSYGPPPEQTSASSSRNNGANVEVEITRFNWGAFFLYSLWGFANGMWWAFLIGVFFGWTIIPNILFGIMGSKWAWKNKHWRDLNHFVTVQDSWKKWGIGLFLVNIFLAILFSVILMAMASAF